jgi:predicted DNA-binding transcriptional regulator YafY
MKSGRVSRIVQILTTLQAGRSCTADELATTFGTSRRTVFRDLKELQLIGIPYRYDSRSCSYTIDPQFFLPPIDLNLQEALSLLLLVYKVSSQMQIPYKNSALLAALKIENNLPARIRQYCNSSLNSISARLNPQAPTGALDRIFGQLQKAIETSHKVKIRYHSLFENENIELEFDPYHLMYNQRAWYVVGHSHIHKSLRTFKLNRITSLQTLDKCFLDGGKFDPADYLGRAWSMIPEGKIYNVKLRFLPKVAGNVAEVQWHSTQKVVFNPDGSAIVEFRVDGLGEITWWILGYGDQVQVLAPKALRKKVLDAAAKMIELNENL